MSSDIQCPAFLAKANNVRGLWDHTVGECLCCYCLFIILLIKEFKSIVYLNVNDRAEPFYCQCVLTMEMFCQAAKLFMSVIINSKFNVKQSKR